MWYGRFTARPFLYSHNSNCYLFVFWALISYYDLMGRLEASDAIRRQLHVKVDELWKRKNSLPGAQLRSSAQALKADIERYQPWNSCTIFCFKNPYWKYTDLTERIREIDVLGIARIRGSSSLETGLLKGEAAAERFRGEASGAEKAVVFAITPAGAVTASFVGAEVPGGGKFSATGAETGRNLPGEVEDSWCCMKKAFMPIPGVFDCTCSDPNHPANKLRWLIWIGGTAALLFLLHPYVSLLTKAVRK